MNKIKKLIPTILLSSIFFNASINILAMDDITTSSSSVDEINKLYESSIFNPGNLYNIICINSKNGFNTQIMPFMYRQKVSILYEANRMINAHIEDLNNPDLIKQSKVQYNSPLEYRGDYPFETVMNALTVNLERSGEFNSFAKSIILYRLAEYLELMPVIKVIVYDEYEHGKNVPRYEAVMLYDSGVANPYSASQCIFNPITFDNSRSEFWKKMLKNPKTFNMKEHFLLIPPPNSDKRPLILNINPDFKSDPQFLGLNISRKIRKGIELEKDNDFSFNEVSSELIEEIGKSKC